MSLLDDTRDTVILYPEIDGEDSMGNPKRVVDVAHPQTIYGRVQPASSLESTRDGQNVSTQYVFRTRTFLAGAFGRARWQGRDWDFVGEPMRHNGSDVTAHSTITFQARGPEVLP